MRLQLSSAEIMVRIFSESDIYLAFEVLISPIPSSVPSVQLAHTDPNVLFL
jgi:hypothetical protein